MNIHEKINLKCNLGSCFDANLVNAIVKLNRVCIAPYYGAMQIRKAKRESEILHYCFIQKKYQINKPIFLN